jgi:hypothetical protein
MLVKCFTIYRSAIIATMPNIEIDYPYVAGSHGIPFQEFKTGKQLKISGGSGRELVYDSQEEGIRIADMLSPEYRMYGEIVDGDSVRGDTIRFNLKTRSGEERHPDMFAGRFTKTILDLLTAEGWNITKWLSIWEKWSDNFIQFQRALREGIDPVSAVRMTWSGRNAAKNGFSLEMQDQIIAYDEKHATVLFTRE